MLFLHSQLFQVDQGQDQFQEDLTILQDQYHSLFQEDLIHTRFRSNSGHLGIAAGTTVITGTSTITRCLTKDSLLRSLTTCTRLNIARLRSHTTITSKDTTPCTETGAVATGMSKFQLFLLGQLSTSTSKNTQLKLHKLSSTLLKNHQ